MHSRKPHTRGNSFPSPKGTPVNSRGRRAHGGPGVLGVNDPGGVAHTTKTERERLGERRTPSGFHVSRDNLNDKKRRHKRTWNPYRVQVNRERRCYKHGIPTGLSISPGSFTGCSTPSGSLFFAECGSPRARRPWLFTVDPFGIRATAGDPFGIGTISGDPFGIRALYR